MMELTSQVHSHHFLYKYIINVVYIILYISEATVLRNWERHTKKASRVQHAHSPVIQKRLGLQQQSFCS